MKAIWQWVKEWKKEKPSEFRGCLWYLILAFSLCAITVSVQQSFLCVLTGGLLGSSIMFTVMKISNYKTSDQTIDKRREPKPRFYQFTWIKCLWIGVGFFVVGLFSLILEPLSLIGSFWNYFLSVLSWLLPIGLFIVVVLTIEWPRKGKQEKKGEK